MLKRFLSLVVVVSCLAVADASFAQSPSLAFIDGRGEDAASVGEYGRVRVRMTDPALDVSVARESVVVALSSTLAGDSEPLTLVETGERTGVFEGAMGLWLSCPPGDRAGYIDTCRDSNNINDNDGIQASYGALADSVEVVPSITRFVDASGAGAAAYAAGERIYLRVDDGHSNTPNLDTVLVTVTASGGASAQVTLSETGIDAGVFEGSLVLTAASGETLQATHLDVNNVTSSTATATVAPLAIRFVDAAGRPTSVFLENSQAWVRLSGPSFNTDPNTREAVWVMVSAALSGESELVPLWETTPASGVFEGFVQLWDAATSPGDGQLRAVADTLQASLAYEPPAYVATATTLGARLFLTDAMGGEVSAYAVGSTLYLRVEDQTASDDPRINTTTALLASPATGDQETVTLRETGVGTGVFEGLVRLATGTAAVDGLLQTAAGDTVAVSHGAAQRAAAILPSVVRFVDESGRATSELLEGAPARLEVFDLSAVGQPDADVDLESFIGDDFETVFLPRVSGQPGAFQGSIPLTSLGPALSGDGQLRVSGALGEPFDTVTATRPFTSSTQARSLRSRVRFIDDRGRETEAYAESARVYLRVEDPGSNSTSGVDGTTVGVTATLTGDSETVTLTETGNDTGIFEGWIASGAAPGSVADGQLQAVAGSDVSATYAPYFANHRSTDTARVVARSVELVDAEGLPAPVYVAGGRAYLRAADAAANANPAAAETLSVRLLTLAPEGGTRDSETVVLTETGADTGLFTGSIDLEALQSSWTPEDGAIQSSEDTAPVYESEILRVYFADVEDSARFVDSVLRFVDAQGKDASSYEVGSPVRVRLERALDNFSTSGADTSFVAVRSLETGDVETMALTETGPDTGIFEGTLATQEGAAGNNGILDAQAGESVEAEKGSYILFSADRAVMLGAAGTLTAEDDSANTLEDTAVTVAVLANDSSPDGPLTVTDATVTSGGGSVGINGDWSLTYTPAPNAAGTAVITYTASDGVATATAELTVGVAPVNDPPVAGNDAATTDEDTAVAVSVLGNDGDPENDLLAVVSFSQGANGSVTSNGATVTYTPRANWSGSDSFSYTAGDGNGGTATATVSVTVNPVNDAPDAVNDAASTNEDTSVTVLVRGNDTDAEGQALTVTAVTHGANGTVSINTGASVTYKPAVNFNGTDTFTYTVSDGAATDTATVTVTVAPVADAPWVAEDSAATVEDTPVNIAVLANDFDPDGQPLVVTGFLAPGKGYVTINPDGTLTYTPALNQFGDDLFVYTVSDGTSTNTSVVFLTLSPTPDPPDAVDDAASTAEDVPVTVAVKANDVEPDGQPFTLTAVTQGTQGGLVAMTADQQVTFRPAANFIGTDTFTYTISDGTSTDTATVAVTVAAVDDAAYAVEDAATTLVDTPVVIDVLANDSDPEGQPLAVTGFLPAANGYVVINPDQTVTYTPVAGFEGQDFFIYTVTDGVLVNSTVVFVTVD